MIEGPKHPDIGVVALVYHRWGHHWMTPHHVLARLGSFFHVRWIDPAPEWRNSLKPVPAPVRLGVEAPAFAVDQAPLWLPRIWRPRWLGRFTFVERLRRARRALRRAGCRRFVVYLWHPAFEEALNEPGFDLSCYHVDDDFSFSMEGGQVLPEEVRVLERVDRVYAISPKLLERVREQRPDAEFAPEGVDYPAYASPQPEPVDLAPISRPRIGYTGTLKRQLDWELIGKLVEQHPAYSFVFVGPVGPHPEIQEPIARLRALHNVHFLGAKPTTALPAYVQHFDVCIMPYRVNPYTNSIYPLKLPEYLATGRPVVGAPIRSVRDFETVVHLAASSDDWGRALATALEDTSPEARERRRGLARRYDWPILVAALAESIRRGLEETEGRRGLESRAR